MTLSDRDIRHALNHRQLGIEPFDVTQLQPASYDVRLGQGFLVPANMAYNERVSIDRAAGRFPRYFESKGLALGSHVLNPGQFCLGCTAEVVTIGNGFVARIEGKSTLGRLGLIVHCTAGYIDPGFSGQITLELFNCAPYPIELVPGCPVAQLRFERLSSLAERVYGAPGLGSHYAEQVGVCGPVAPKL
jgi:dCTP deaminase